MQETVNSSNIKSIKTETLKNPQYASKNLFKSITVTEQRNWFFIYSETHTKPICKIEVARKRNKRDHKQLYNQCIKST